MGQGAFLRAISSCVGAPSVHSHLHMSVLIRPDASRKRPSLPNQACGMRLGCRSRDAARPSHSPLTTGCLIAASILGTKHERDGEKGAVRCISRHTAFTAMLEFTSFPSHVPVHLEPKAQRHERHFFPHGVTLRTYVAFDFRDALRRRGSKLASLDILTALVKSARSDSLRAAPRRVISCPEDDLRSATAASLDGAPRASLSDC